MMQAEQGGPGQESEAELRSSRPRHGVPAGVTDRDALSQSLYPELALPSGYERGRTCFYNRTIQELLRS
jgi:hypothetical protein